jgi:hypothetical protein
MEQEVQEINSNEEEHSPEMRTVIQETIQEYLASERAKAEPAYKTELAEERRRREQLEKRVNELVSENERSRRMAAEAERSAAIRDELRRLGVAKVDLGFRAVKDDIVRAEDGRLVARTDGGEVEMRDYLTRFTRENPELLPARISGGSGAAAGSNEELAVGLEQVKPGMDPEQLSQFRDELAKALSHTRGSR